MYNYGDHPFCIFGDSLLKYRTVPKKLLLPATVDESCYMFLKDSDSPIASSDNTGSTGSTANLETLQYLNNKDTSLKSLKFILQ